MRAVTFQAPGVVSVEDRPEPEIVDSEDAIVKVEATGVCGSDLHIYHGRVLGCFQTACGSCWFCRRGLFHRCLQSRTFGHGATLGSLQGTQAEMALVPRANLVLRKVPEGMSSDTALFAGDVMGTGFHAVEDSGLRPGDVAAVLGLGPVGLCAVQAARAAGAAHVFAIDTVPERLAVAESFGAEALHLGEQDVR